MKRKGFTLVEMVLILTVVFILAAIGAWKVAGLKAEATGVARDDALATVLRMQQLADMEGLQETAADTLGRIMELESNLVAKGHYYYQFNPTNLAERVIYDPAAQQWRNP